MKKLRIWMNDFVILRLKQQCAYLRWTLLVSLENNWGNHPSHAFALFRLKWYRRSYWFGRYKGNSIQNQSNPLKNEQCCHLINLLTIRSSKRKCSDCAENGKNKNNLHFVITMGINSSWISGKLSINQMDALYPILYRM